jgi:hypothetical protein
LKEQLKVFNKKSIKEEDCERRAKDFSKEKFLKRITSVVT